MKTEQELKDLSADIGHAIMRYISAVAENLQELGHDVPVQGDDEYVDGIELMVEFDGQLNNCTINKVRYDPEKKEIMCFCKTWNYHENNDWMYLSELGDDFDYVLRAIQWENSNAIVKNSNGKEIGS